MADFTLRRQFLGWLAAGTIVAGGCLGRRDESDQHEGDQPTGHADDHETPDPDDADDHEDHDHDDTDDHEGEETGNHDHDEHDLGTPLSAADVGMVSNGGHHFVPHVVRLEVGGTIEWVNESGTHNAVAYHPANADALPTTSQLRIPESADPFETALLGEGESETVSLGVEGIYDYACVPHESAGMVGRIIVGDPDLDDEPAMNEPADEMPDAAADQFRRFNDTTREALGH